MFELRHSQNLANRAPLAELSVLLLCAGSVLLGFAAAERAELHLARVAVLSVVPVALLIRGLTGADLAVRRGRRTPLWVPGGLVLGGLLAMRRRRLGQGLSPGIDAQIF